MTTHQTFTDNKKLTAPEYYLMSERDVGDYVETRLLVKQRALPYGQDKFWKIAMLVCGVGFTLTLVLAVIGIPMIIYNAVSLRGTKVISYVTHQRHKETGELKVIRD